MFSQIKTSSCIYSIWFAQSEAHIVAPYSGTLSLVLAIERSRKGFTYCLAFNYEIKWLSCSPFLITRSCLEKNSHDIIRPFRIKVAWVAKIANLGFGYHHRSKGSMVDEDAITQPHPRRNPGYCC